MNWLINVLAWPFGIRRVAITERRPMSGDLVGPWLVAWGMISRDQYLCRTVMLGHRWERR